MSNGIKLPAIAYEHIMSITDKREQILTASAYQILAETYGYPNDINNSSFANIFIEGFVACANYFNIQ